MQKQWFEDGDLQANYFDWLINQAEEKQVLEGNLIRHEKFISNNYSDEQARKRIVELEERVKELKYLNRLADDTINFVEFKNKRYEQALEFYADEKNHTEPRGTKVFGDVFYDEGKTARQALNQ